MSATSSKRLRTGASMLAGRRPRGLALVALALVVVETVADEAGGAPVGLSLAALVLAPGLALLPLLPARVRRHPLAALAAAPALGFAAMSVLLISISRA